MRVGLGLILVVAAVLGLGAGAGLAAYQASQQPAAGAAAGGPDVAAQRGGGQRAAGGAGDTPAASAAQSGGGQPGQQRGGAVARGVVASAGEKEFSLKTESSVTPVVVRVDDRTAIRKQAAGDRSDIKPAERISVRGEAQADGTLAAATVQIVAAEGEMALFGGQGQARGQAAPSGAPFRGGGQAPGQGRSQATQPGAPFGGDRAQGGAGTLIGTVKEVAGDVVSVTRPGDSGADDTLVKVTLSDKTTVTKTVAGDLKDIAEGASVMASGPRGADGVITASSVQILPAAAASAGATQE